MSERSEILLTAEKLTAGERNEDYKKPHDNLNNCALLWTAYLYGKYEGVVYCLTAEDVAWLNVLQKIARTFKSNKRDNYIDAAAYSAIAGECKEEESPDDQ